MKINLNKLIEIKGKIKHLFNSEYGDYVVWSIVGRWTIYNGETIKYEEPVSYEIHYNIYSQQYRIKMYGHNCRFHELYPETIKTLNQLKSATPSPILTRTLFEAMSGLRNNFKKIENLTEEDIEKLTIKECNHYLNLSNEKEDYVLSEKINKRLEELKKNEK